MLSPTEIAVMVLEYDTDRALNSAIPEHERIAHLFDQVDLVLKNKSVQWPDPNEAHEYRTQCRAAVLKRFDDLNFSLKQTYPKPANVIAHDLMCSITTDRVEDSNDAPSLSEQLDYLFGELDVILSKCNDKPHNNAVAEAFRKACRLEVLKQFDALDNRYVVIPSGVAS